MTIAVVTVARAGAGVIERLLANLEDEAAGRELVVVNCGGPDIAARVASRFPRVKLVQGHAGLTGAQSRYLGIEQTSADVVAVVHERYAIPRGWLAAVEAVHRRDIDVAGGGIAPGTAYSNLAWAMYLTEYSQVAPPLPEGPLDRKSAMLLPGGNVSYKRRVFALAPMAQALSELDFHEALHAAGVRFVRAPGMDVQFAAPLTLAEYREERSKFSHAYGMRRFAGAPAAARLLAAAARLALPPLLLARYARQAWAKRNLRRRYLPALPWMAYFAWIQMRAEMAGILSSPW